jgi:hypothetical protein
MTQLDRIESKLDRLLDLLDKKPRKVKPASSAQDYPKEFEELWALYPKRSGSNPKKKAFFAWRARFQEISGMDDAYRLRRAMTAGVERYAAWCNATGKTGTETVMQAARFFGPNREWENEYQIQLQVVRVPRDMDRLIPFAAERGIQARPGEDLWQFRQRVEDSI